MTSPVAPSTLPRRHKARRYSWLTLPPLWLVKTRFYAFHLLGTVFAPWTCKRLLLHPAAWISFKASFTSEILVLAQISSNRPTQGFNLRLVYTGPDSGDRGYHLPLLTYTYY